MAIIGIDLGTTNSLACVFKDGKPQLIPNKFGKFLTPSVVSIDGEKIFVGQSAKERLIAKPDVTKASFKRFMGHETDIRLGNKSFRAEELSAFILKQLVEDAEAFLGEKVTEAIISVPAYFNDDMRQATKNAATICGIYAERVINEPSAAALYNRFLNKDEGDSLLLIIDLGGGTLDVSVVECYENVVSVLSVSGDNHLGGDDFDLAIAKYFCEMNNLNFDLLTLKDKGILLNLAQKSKVSMSCDKGVFCIQMQTETLNGSVMLTYRDFIKICNDLFKRLQKPIIKALNNAELSIDDIDDIVLIGGGCKIKAVRQFISHITNRQLKFSNDSDMAVALGVGIYSGIKSRNEDIKEMILTDICPFSLGVATKEHKYSVIPIFSPIIQRNSTLPISVKKSYIPLDECQNSIEFDIYQGESIVASENVYLGSLEVPLPKSGNKVVDVQFAYDINGILEVKVGSGNKIYKKVLMSENAKNLSEEKIDSIIQSFAKYKKTDKSEEVLEYIISYTQSIYEQVPNLNLINDALKSFIYEFEQTSSNRKKQKLINSFMSQLNYIKSNYNLDYLDDIEAEDYFWLDEYEKNQIEKEDDIYDDDV